MLEVCIKLSRVMVWNMMNSKKSAVQPGVKNSTFSVLTCIEKMEINNRIFNESNNTLIECFPESEAF